MNHPRFRSIGRRPRPFAFCTAIVTILLVSSGWAVPARAEVKPIPEDLTTLTLEDLLGIEVTSASKKLQRVSDAPAAIFVITQDDIRTSGATSIPELLRMVPGIQVARLDSNKWAVTSRGFEGRFANKLLVLFDGRTVYTPLFSGVFWEDQDYLLEDIDRIEVIRGPGASLWGANAVNGVINIITKHSKDTQGALISSGAGTYEQGFVGVRYGGRLSPNLTYRLYGKYFNRGTFDDEWGMQGADDWWAYRSGFRLDYDKPGKDALTLQGDLYHLDSGSRYLVPAFTAPYADLFDHTSNHPGGNVLFRWSHTFSPSSQVSLITYYDRAQVKDVILSNVTDTFDIDFQHTLKLAPWNELIWGLGYRYYRDNIDNSEVVTFDPSHTRNQLLSAFIQDEFKFLDDHLRLTLGSRFEHNDYTGFEAQPTARLLWAPNPDHSVWTAFSRAVRTPSQVEWDADSIAISVIPPFTPVNPSPFPVVAEIVGSHDYGSEELKAFELGYRFQANKSLAVDISGFYNLYDDLRTTERGRRRFELFPAPHFVIPLKAANRMDGETYGVEVAADWHPLKWWRLNAAYTFLYMDLETDRDSTDLYTAKSTEGVSPRHQFSFRSRTELPKNLELDLWLRYVDSLSGIDVPGYVTMDARLAWRPQKGLELAVVGQNLLDAGHLEFRPDFLNSLPTEIQRGVYGKITWSF